MLFRLSMHRLRQKSRHVFRFKVGCEIWQCECCGLGSAETSTFNPKNYYTVEYFSGLRSDGYSDYLGAEPVLRREFVRSVDFVRLDLAVNDLRSSNPPLMVAIHNGWNLLVLVPYLDGYVTETSEREVTTGNRDN